MDPKDKSSEKSDTDPAEEFLLLNVACHFMNFLLGYVVIYH